MRHLLKSLGTTAINCLVGLLLGDMYYQYVHRLNENLCLSSHLCKYTFEGGGTKQA